MKRPNIFLISSIILFFIIIGIIVGFINLIVDFEWFSDLHYLDVFFKKFLTQLSMGIPIFILVFMVLYFYTNKIIRDYVNFAQDIIVKKNVNLYRKLGIAISLLTALFITLYTATNWWNDLLFFINYVDFNETDPIFHKDISFYMFKLPLFYDIYNLLIVFIPVMMVVTIVAYGLMYLSDKTRFYEISDRDGNLFKAIYNKDILIKAFKEVALLGFVFFVLIGIGYYLKAYKLLYSTKGIVFGATYTDIHVSLQFYKALVMASFVAAVLLLIGFYRKNIKYVAAAPAIIIILAAVMAIAETAVQSLIVSPNELNKEKKYIGYNIEYTKKAFGLDRVTEKNYDMKKELTPKVLEENKATIDNIMINDYRPVKQAYNQLQAIRLYYKFNDIDIDRYIINGKYRQVFLSAREMDHDSLSPQAKTWINLHLKYTHGYGVVMSLVNDVTPTGQPDMIIKNIPPYTTTDIKIDRPEIYFGELTNNYAIVNTKTGEFDYPSGDKNVQTNYKGTTGIPMTFINRILFSIYTKDARILLSTDITKDSKILIYRNIIERVSKIAPFLLYDDDPYIVIDNGKLYWIIDAYTYSANYPYSQPYGNMGINYIRNSVKVVVDAYNGDVKYYISDKSDPLIKVYSKIFPTLFRDIKEMPHSLKRHIRYPQFLFDIQAEVYKNYHMTDPQVFYNKEDAWDIAKEKFEDKIEYQESQYLIMRLPGESKEEYILMIPYTPATKANMVAWMAARMDGDNYGRLIVYKFSKNTIVYGPLQIENMIDQDPNISKELSLWNQQGSTVSRGNLLSIPIDDSMLYVEPLYIQSQNQNALPEVKRVIVAYKDQIAMEDTLKNALNKLFNINTQLIPQQNVPSNTANDTQKQLIEKAHETYQNAMEAVQKGKWADFGKYMEELRKILDELNKSVKK